jgi:hypothetical protein
VLKRESDYWQLLVMDIMRML